ncbi:MAG TPA: flavin reductase family protein [Acidothermaceae bacterium]|jgi:flavin reductase (DIM6/NTAB) family NADH-FMN oxidoreductase RutF|nr:flavin reductase family protein [Acidothermaceae bacterium]
MTSDDMTSDNSDDAALRAGLDDLLRHANQPMVIVTARDKDGERAGCLVGFSSQCAIDPPLYAVWLSVQNRTFEVARRADHLAVHLLAKNQRPLAELFGSVTDHDHDKFAHCEWDDGPYGLPILRQAAGWFAGPVRAIPSSGDHELFIVNPQVARGRLDEQPLSFQDVKDLHAGNPA